MNALKSLLFAFAGLAGLVSCTGEPARKKIDFATQVKPVLESRCANCHHSGAMLGNLNLENRDFAFRPRPTGAVIVPGSAATSSLYLALTLQEGEGKAMPPTGHRIPPEEVDLIKRWIDEGAHWPEGAEGRVRSLAGSAPPEY